MAPAVPLLLGFSRERKVRRRQNLLSGALPGNSTSCPKSKSLTQECLQFILQSLGQAGNKRLSNDSFRVASDRSAITIHGRIFACRHKAVLVLTTEKELAVANTEQPKLRGIEAEIDEVPWVSLHPNGLRLWPYVGYLRVLGPIEFKLGVLERITSPEQLSCPGYRGDVTRV